MQWLTKTITRHIRKRNAAFQAARKSGKSEHHSKFRKLRNKVVKLMRSAKSSYFQRLNPKDKKQFWKAIKYLNKQQSSIPTLHYQDTAAESNSEKANLLNEFFSACFSRDIPPLSPADTNYHNAHYDSCPEDLLCTTDEVLFLIETLDSSNANGPDGISAQMLKATAHSNAPSLTKLSNLSISQGHFPESWKTSTIPKSANHKEATNYRPISLLSIQSKMQKRHLHQFITNHLNDHHPLSNKQWGFQSGKSTVAALLSVTHDWFQALEYGQEVCSIFSDLKKAFDSVPHCPLLDKLARYGLDAHTLSWITTYLTNRKQHVVVGGETSSDTPVLFYISGVLQGSVLGPLLFLVYIDDVPESLLSDGSVLNLYADDMLLYKPVRSLEDFRHLQSDIDHISDWVSCNHLTLNPNKCIRL